jgi:methyl-accepting chemotaxis protein
MEEFWINLLSNVPIGVAILVIWFFMAKGQNNLEAQREKNRGADEKARNDQTQKLIDMYALTIEALQGIRSGNTLMRQTLENNTDALTDLHAGMDRQFGDTMQILTPLAAHAEETVEVVRDLPAVANETRGLVQALQERIGKLETMLQTTLGAVQTLHDYSKQQGQTTDEIAGTLDQWANQLSSELAAIRRDIRTLVDSVNTTF